MTRKEAERQTRQVDTLQALGFSRDEAVSLRRISVTLQGWYELECNGIIQRDEDTTRPYWYSTDGDKIGIAVDREIGARKRLKTIIEARNIRVSAEPAVCGNCGQWQYIDCVNGCTARGLAQGRKVWPYIQTDPRGCALYILRPGDVPNGEDAGSYYDCGLAVY